MNSLLPRRADNGYEGRTLALWAFGVVIAMRAGTGLGAIFNGYDAASSADGIPLATFSPAAVQTSLGLFALLGAAHVLVSAIGLIVLTRYRSLVPLMFTLLLAYQLARSAILRFIPIPRSGPAPVAWISLTLVALMISGLLLSLWRRKPASFAARASTLHDTDRR